MRKRQNPRSTTYLRSTRWVVTGRDLISGSDAGGVQEYYLYDGLGSTTDLTDGSGNAVGGYGYDVFGAIRSQAGGSANSGRPPPFRSAAAERAGNSRRWRIDTATSRK